MVFPVISLILAIESKKYQNDENEINFKNQSSHGYLFSVFLLNENSD